MAGEKQDFKVVVDIPGANNGVTVKAGLTKKQATADAKERNDKAEAVGLKTRYQVVPL